MINMPVHQITKEQKERIEHLKEEIALRNEYHQYTLEFKKTDEEIKKGLDISDGNRINQLVGKLSYSEWLLEQILLSLRKP